MTLFLYRSELGLKASRCKLETGIDPGSDSRKMTHDKKDSKAQSNLWKEGAVGLEWDLGKRISQKGIRPPPPSTPPRQRWIAGKLR